MCLGLNFFKKKVESPISSWKPSASAVGTAECVCKNIMFCSHIQNVMSATEKMLNTISFRFSIWDYQDFLKKYLSQTDRFGLKIDVASVP